MLIIQEVSHSTHKTTLSSFQLSDWYMCASHVSLVLWSNYVFVCVYVCGYMCVCMYMCMCVCLCACDVIYIYIYISEIKFYIAQTGFEVNMSQWPYHLHPSVSLSQVLGFQASTTVLNQECKYITNLSLSNNSGKPCL